MKRIRTIREALRIAVVVILCAALAIPASALAAAPQLAVLRFAGEGFSKAMIDSATNAAESAALRASAGRFKIVTRDMLAAVVGEEKLLKCEETARCELDLGVGLGTGYLLAGSLRRLGARTELTVKLYDVQKLDLLAQEKETARTDDELLDRVTPVVARMMREAFPPRVDPSAADAAMARYDAMEPAFAEFDRISLDVEPRYLKAQLELKARKLREAEEGYGKVVLMKQAEPAVCALYKIGLMYRRFAGALLDTAVPEEIQNDPSLVEEYRTVLRQQAEPLESKAKDGFALAVNAARDYSVRNECVRRAEAMLSGAR